jgi:hypothetical protein
VFVLLESIEEAAQKAANDLQKDIGGLGPQEFGVDMSGCAQAAQDLATALGGVISKLDIIVKMGDEIAQVRISTARE